MFSQILAKKLKIWGAKSICKYLSSYKMNLLLGIILDLWLDIEMKYIIFSIFTVTTYKGIESEPQIQIITISLQPDGVNIW